MLLFLSLLFASFHNQSPLITMTQLTYQNEIEVLTVFFVCKVIYM